MHDRGSILTLKMFWPLNHDVQSRNARISFHGKQGDFTRETLDYREPTETWQVVEALQVYTMAMARVWPEDWTGHALQRILTTYRWIAKCGRAKASKVRLLIDFINHVLAENATNGRHHKPPLTYQKIKEAMANRIWSRGISREACQTGRDPYSSTPDGSRIPKNDGYTGANTTYTHPSTGAGSSNNGSKRGKGSNPPQKG